MKHTLSAILAVSSLIFLCSLFSISCSATPSGEKGTGETVVNTCSACHGIDKVCAKLGQMDMDAWSRTVFGMKQKGARVEDKDITVMAEYLAGLKPGSGPVCK